MHRIPQVKLTNPFLFIFPVLKSFLYSLENYQLQISSGGKVKWKIYQQHANFYFKFLRITHQIAFVLQVRFYIVLLSQEYATQDVYLLLKENFVRVLTRRAFFNRRQIFPPIRGT